jgi:allantoin racemase
MTDRPILAVINPNTDTKVTAFMSEIVASTVGDGIRVDGRTVAHGPPIVTTEETLAIAANEVFREGAMAAASGAEAILVSGFGDPGVDLLKRNLAIPVTGIAEAAMAEAAFGGRRFSIVTTTPLLKASIEESAARYGYADRLAAVRITEGDAETTMANPETLAAALLALCEATIAEDGAEAIVIGGGPLALAAKAIEARVPVPLIEPVRAGARLAAKRLHRLTERKAHP